MLTTLATILEKVSNGRVSTKQNSISANFIYGLIIQHIRKAYDSEGEVSNPPKYLVTLNPKDQLIDSKLTNLLQKVITDISRNEISNHFQLNAHLELLIFKIKKLSLKD